MSREKTRTASGKVVFTQSEEKLRTVLLDKGIPYSEISRLCGVSMPVLSRFINRKRGLTSENFCKLLEFVGIELMLRETFRVNGKLVTITIKPNLEPRPQGRMSADEEARAYDTVSKDPPRPRKVGREAKK